MPVSLAKKTSSSTGQRTTRVRPAPNFKKLHQKFEQQFEQGKACTKKPSTVVEEFDLSKGGSKLQFVQVKTPGRTPGHSRSKTNNDEDKENYFKSRDYVRKEVRKEEDPGFAADKSALESILDNTGISLETLYPQQQQVVCQTVGGKTLSTPPMAVIRRQTSATENIRRSIYYTGDARPSWHQAYSEYARHMVSMSERITAQPHSKVDKTLGASPSFKDKRVPYGKSPLLMGKSMPRMSIFDMVPSRRTPAYPHPGKPEHKPQRILLSKAPALGSPSFKVPTSAAKSSKKANKTWKDVLNEDQNKLQKLEELEKELESDIDEMEQKTASGKKVKKTASQRSADSPRRRVPGSPRTPGRKARGSRLDALANLSPMRTPGQQASPKRKAEALASKLAAARLDPSCTPPKSKRPVRENDITPKSDKPKSGKFYAKTINGESPRRAILGELSPSVYRNSPKHLSFQAQEEMEDKENCHPVSAAVRAELTGDESFFVVEDDDDDYDDDDIKPLEDEESVEDLDELNHTLNMSVVQMEDLEEQANKARRRTEDPDKLMEQLQLIQKKQKELMDMQMDLQKKLKRAQVKKSGAKSQPEVTKMGPVKATHAPTPSKRWKAQQQRQDDAESDTTTPKEEQVEVSEDQTSAEPTPLRKVLFPEGLNAVSAKKEVHFRDEVDIRDITALDFPSLSSGGFSLDDPTMGFSPHDGESPSLEAGSSMFESPVEVRIYGQTGEVDQTWKTQAITSVTYMPAIASQASIPSQTPNKHGIRPGSLHSFTSLSSALEPVMCPLQIDIPVRDCGFPRSDSLLGLAGSTDPFPSLSPALSTGTPSSPFCLSPGISRGSPFCTPTKSTQYDVPSYDPPQSPHTPTSIFKYSVTSALSPCDVTLSPLNISAADISDAGSLSLTANLSPCRGSPRIKSRSLLDQCLLTQAQIKYEEALADDEVSRYMNRLSAMPRAPSPFCRCREPLSKMLEEGDDKHFVPLWKPEESCQESAFYPIVCPVPGGQPPS